MSFIDAYIRNLHADCVHKVDTSISETMSAAFVAAGAMTMAEPIESLKRSQTASRLFAAALVLIVCRKVIA